MCTFREHGFCNAVKVQYHLVSNTPSCVVVDYFNRHSTKGKFAIVLKFHCKTE